MAAHGPAMIRPRCPPPMPLCRHHAAVLSLLVLAGAGAAHAQRPFQDFWRNRYREMVAPAIVEDDAPPLDPARQVPTLGNPGAGDTFGGMVFSSGTAPADATTSPALMAYVRGVVTLEEGSPAQALEHFTRAIEADPTMLRYRLRAAEAAIAVNDLARAKALLDEVLERDPANTEAMLQLGQSFLLRNRFGDARTWYSRALERAPNNIEALRALTQIAAEVERDPARTKELARRILRLDDRNLHGLLLHAEASAQTGDTAEAQGLYRRLLAQRPGLVDRVALQASRLAASNRIEEAAAIYQVAVQSMPDYDPIRVAWEELLLRTGGDERVRQGYQQLLADSAGDTAVQDLYARYLRRVGDWPALVALRESMIAGQPDHLPALMDLAEHRLAQGDLAGAEPFFNAAVAANPADPEVYREIGRAYSAAGDSARARPMLERARALAPSDAEVLDLLAAVEEREGRPAQAASLLREALDLDPANPFLLKRLGALHLAIGKRREARDYYQQVLAGAPGDVETWITIARLSLEDGDQPALDLLEQQATTRLRANPEFEFSLGALLLEFGEHERARRALERGLRDAPANLIARRQLATAYIHLALPDMAMRAIEEGRDAAVAAGIPASVVDRLAAETAQRAGRFADAESRTRRLLEAEPNDIELHRALINALLAQQKDDAAREALNTVVQRLGADNYREVQLLRAAVLLELGETARAVGRLKALLTEFPGDPDITLKLAMAAGEAGDLPLAESLYRELMGRGPGPANEYYENASNNLGYLLATHGIRLDEAQKLVEDALALSPNAGYILDSLGWVHFQRGDYETALRHLQRAARLIPNDGEVYLHLAQTYEKLGRIDEARQYYDRAVGADPRSAEARQRRDAFAAAHPTTGTPSPR